MKLPLHTSTPVLPASRRKIQRLLVGLIFLLLVAQALFVAAPGTAARAQSTQPQVLYLQTDDAVAPAMVEYVRRGLRLAEAQDFDALVLRLNTPGGTVDAMNKIVQDLRASAVPVIVWVAPRGAMAASAGTLITLAGHAAAMAPETSIGAASPVGGQGEDLQETMAAKEKNMLKAIVRSLASQRGEAAIRLAESAIESAQAATAQEALDAGLVDVLAADIEDLLGQLDGKTVLVNDEAQTLRLAGAAVTELSPSLIEQLLAILASPNIVYLLIAIGIQAILIEISSPGGWVAGFIGVVCLALAIYGLGFLPVNWFGILFLVVAFVLFILDIKAPTHGALTAAGVATLIAGALVLFNSPNVPSIQRVSVPLVIVTSLITGAIFLTIMLFAIRAQKTPIRVGQESVIGKSGTVRVEINPVGIVQLSGEQWSAQLAPGEPALPRGTRVVVVDRAGLRLVVRRA